MYVLSVVVRLVGCQRLASCSFWLPAKNIQSPRVGRMIPLWHASGQGALDWLTRLHATRRLM